MKTIVPNILLYTVFAFLFTAAESARSAEVFISESSNNSGYKFGNIQGDIDRDTVAKAIALADQTGVNSFCLDSGGGDIEAAIDLGRYFRRKETTVLVLNQANRDSSGTCASACLFLLAGAVRRYIIVPRDHIGVHRPYILQKVILRLRRQPITTRG